MPGAPIVESADIDRAVHHAPDLGPIDEPKFVITEPLLRLVQLLPQLVKVPRFGRGVQVAPFEVAIDAIALHTLPDQRLSLLGDRKKFSGIVEADLLFYFAEACRKSGTHLATIASRGAPADPMRLQNYDVVAALRQLERRGNARIAGADDD